MKRLFVAAGLFGAVGLLTAAPASARGDVRSPALRPSCATSSECPDARTENIVTAPGRAYQDIVTAPQRAYQDIVTAPGRAYQDIVTAPGRAYQDIVTAPGRAFHGHRDGAATRAGQHPRAVRSCSRSGVTAVDSRSDRHRRHSKSWLAALIRYTLAGAALVHPSTRWAWTRPLSGGHRSALSGCSASNPAGRHPFPRPGPGIC